MQAKADGQGLYIEGCSWEFGRLGVVTSGPVGQQYTTRGTTAACLLVWQGQHMWVLCTAQRSRQLTSFCEY